jgi:hypothetical protein
MDEFDKLAEQMERKLGMNTKNKKISETFTTIPAEEFISDATDYEWKLKGNEAIQLSRHDIEKYGFNFPYKKRINN